MNNTVSHVTQKENPETAKTQKKAATDISKLLEAAYKGLTEVAKALIAAGADVNQADNDGWTPLHWAAGEGHTEVAEALIAAGAKE